MSVAADAEACRACGRDRNLEFSGIVSNSYRLMRCQRCLCVLVEDTPSDEELKAMYDDLFAVGAYEQHRREFEALLTGHVPGSYYRELMMRKVAQVTTGRRLIEIGGGTGAFAALATALGYVYSSYDISEVAVRCQRELGYSAHLFDPSEVPPIRAGSADVVVMWEVLEHVWDVRGHLELIKSALSPDGVFVFSTPNFARSAYRRSLQEGGGSRPPIHINFFDPPSLAGLFESRGWNRLTLVRNRFMRPSATPRSLVRSLRVAARIDESETLFGIAQ